jgi:hypothetical protein
VSIGFHCVLCHACTLEAMRTQAHFFSSAIQFSTTVNGGRLASSALVTNRKPLPVARRILAG